MTADERDEIFAAIEFYDNDNIDWREVVLFIILKQTDTLEDYLKRPSYNRYKNVGRPRRDTNPPPTSHLG